MFLNFILSSILTLSMLVTPSEEINGYVFDQNTNEPLTGVKITINDNTIKYTDFDGKFTVNNYSDTINIRAEFISYDNLEIIFIKNK